MIGLHFTNIYNLKNYKELYNSMWAKHILYIEEVNLLEMAKNVYLQFMFFLLFYPTLWFHYALYWRKNP